VYHAQSSCRCVNLSMDQLPTSSQAVFELELEVIEDNQPILDLLADNCAFSRSKIKQMMKQGEVWLQPTKEQSRNKIERRIRRAKATLAAGDVVRVYHNEAVYLTAPPKPTLIADEGIYSVWSKPAGLMSSGTRFGDHCAINRWVEQNLAPQREAHLIHRLDRFATGLIVLAHTKSAAAALSKQFSDRTVSKCYRVIVEGIISDPLRIDSELDGKPSISKLVPTSINQDMQQTTLEVTIETGRKHQIRRHLAGIGHPVLGDRQYGTGEGELTLRSIKLAFDHPQTGNRMAYILDT
jgi:tRNA pseudouridine32 synthase / 23S rRNA pseudouridine746 synthase